MKIKNLIKELNLEKKVFKPGYLVGREVYMILSPTIESLKKLESRGAKVSHIACGWDFNYNGTLYKITAK